MKKKLNVFLGLLSIATLIMSCSEEDNENMLQSNTGNPTSELNLSAISYEVLASQLNQVSDCGKTIVLEDKGFNRQIHVTMDKRTKIELEGEKIRLFNGEAKDSTNFILGEKFAVLRFYRNGESINYVAYKDAQMMKEVADLYITPLTGSRAVNQTDAFECIYDSKTRSSEKKLQSVKINIDKAKEILDLPEPNFADDFITIPQSELDTESIQTRAIPSEPKTVHVVCLKENGSTIYPNEVSAQMVDAANSVYAVHGAKRYINLSFVLNVTEFGCTDGDADKGLTDFVSSLKSDPRAEGYDDQIYFLIRWGTWDKNTLGIAYVDSYNVSKASNFRASGMCTTQLMYPGTMAHELGHILGAGHVQDNEDLMYYSNKGNLYHRSDGNMSVIATNLGWEPADGD